MLRGLRQLSGRDCTCGRSRLCQLKADMKSINFKSCIRVAERVQLKPDNYK